MRALLRIACALWVFPALASAQSPSGKPGTVANRLMVVSDWTTQWDTNRMPGVSLLRPELIAAEGDITYVFDYGHHSLKAIARDGSIRWSMGKRGTKNGEFRNPTDVQIGDGGTIWILDAATHRITAVDQNGNLLRTLPVPREVQRIIPVRGGHVVGLANVGSVLLYEIDMDGNVIPRLNAPDSLQRLDPLARQMVVRGSGGFWVMGFLHGDLMGILQQHTHGYSLRTFRGIERVDFAAALEWTVGGRKITRLSPDAVEGARSVGIVGDSIYVHFGGRSANAGRIVDFYSAFDGEYRGSILLPELVDRLIMLPDGVAVGLIKKPAPGVKFWAWKAANNFVASLTAGL